MQGNVPGIDLFLDIDGIVESRSTARRRNKSVLKALATVLGTITIATLTVVALVAYTVFYL